MDVTGWINLTLVLAVLATCLQVAGYVAPMWIWMDVDDFRVGVGLWYTVGCGLKGTCSSPAPTVAFGYTTDDTWSQPQFNAVRGLQTLGVAGAVLLLLFLVVYRAGYGKWTNMGELNLAAFFTATINWVCIVAGLIVYCAYYWPVVGTSPMLNSTSFPWSLVMCLFGAFFFIVVSILIRLKCRDRSRLKNAIPISGDTRMESYPVTKHGLLHRYFLPLYRGLRGNSRAVGYQSEAKTMHTVNTRLVDAEEHTHVAAIDNAAFYETRLPEPSNVKYRHLPVHNGHANSALRHDQAQTVIRRSLPTAIVTYADGEATDIHRLQTQGGAAAAATATGAAGHHIDDPHHHHHNHHNHNHHNHHQHHHRRGHSFGGAHDGGLLLRHADDITREVTTYRERDGQASRVGVTGRRHSGGGTPRDGADHPHHHNPHHPHQGGVTSRDAAYRGAGAMMSEQAAATTTTTRTGDVTYRGTGEAGAGTVLQEGGVSHSGEAGGSREARFLQNGVAGMRDHHHHLHYTVEGGDAARTAGGHHVGGGGGRGGEDGGAGGGVGGRAGDGRAYLSEAHGREVAAPDGAFGHSGTAVRRDAFGNIITEEERVVTTATTTTTTYLTEEERHRRGGLKVTEIESNEGGFSSKKLSARGKSGDWDDGGSVRPYDDTYIYRPIKTE